MVEYKHEASLPLSACLSVCLSVCLSLCKYIMHVPDTRYDALSYFNITSNDLLALQKSTHSLCLCLFVFISVCLSVYLSVSLRLSVSSLSLCLRVSWYLCPSL